MAKRNNNKGNTSLSAYLSPDQMREANKGRPKKHRKDNPMMAALAELAPKMGLGALSFLLSGLVGGGLTHDKLLGRVAVIKNNKPWFQLLIGVLGTTIYHFTTRNVKGGWIAENRGSVMLGMILHSVWDLLNGAMGKSTDKVSQFVRQSFSLSTITSLPAPTAVAPGTAPTAVAPGTAPTAVAPGTTPTGTITPTPTPTTAMDAAKLSAILALPKLEAVYKPSTDSSDYGQFLRGGQMISAEVVEYGNTGFILSSEKDAAGNPKYRITDNNGVQWHINMATEQVETTGHAANQIVSASTQTASTQTAQQASDAIIGEFDAAMQNIGLGSGPTLQDSNIIYAAQYAQEGLGRRRPSNPWGNQF